MIHKYIHAINAIDFSNQNKLKTKIKIIDTPNKCKCKRYGIELTNYQLMVLWHIQI